MWNSSFQTGTSGNRAVKSKRRKTKWTLWLPQPIACRESPGHRADMGILGAWWSPWVKENWGFRKTKGIRVHCAIYYRREAWTVNTVDLQRSPWNFSWKYWSADVRSQVRTTRRINTTMLRDDTGVPTSQSGKTWKFIWCYCKYLEEYWSLVSWLKTAVIPPNKA